jgi:hypothetical protein
MWKTHPNSYECSWNYDKEDFEVVKFIENRAPFSMLLENPGLREIRPEEKKRQS